MHTHTHIHTLTHTHTHTPRSPLRSPPGCSPAEVGIKLDWLREMSAYLRSIDSHHLITQVCVREWEVGRAGL